MADAERIKYASRGVYGNTAYELEPQRKFAPEPEEQPVPEPTPRPASRPKPQTKYGVSLMAILGFAAAACFLVVMLLAYVSFEDVAYETTELENRLEELESEERRLLIAYEAAFDINELEDYAVNELGMVKPVEAQMSTVDITVENEAEILSKDSGGGLGDFVSFIKSLLSYL